MVLKKSLSCEVATVTSPSDFFHEELIYSHKKTLVIGIGFPRYTRLKMAHTKSFRTLVIRQRTLSLGETCRPRASGPLWNQLLH